MSIGGAQPLDPSQQAMQQQVASAQNPSLQGSSEQMPTEAHLVQQAVAGTLQFTGNLDIAPGGIQLHTQTAALKEFGAQLANLSAEDKLNLSQTTTLKGLVDHLNNPAQGHLAPVVTTIITQLHQAVTQLALHSGTLPQPTVALPTLIPLHPAGLLPQQGIFAPEQHATGLLPQPQQGTFAPVQHETGLLPQPPAQGTLGPQQGTFAPEQHATGLLPQPQQGTFAPVQHETGLLPQSPTEGTLVPEQGTFIPEYQTGLLPSPPSHATLMAMVGDIQNVLDKL